MGLPLEGVNDVVDSFLAEATQLGDKLGPLLVQLPPSLQFSADIAERFFSALRDRFDGDVAVEPRHPTWFEPEAGQMVTKYRWLYARTGPLTWRERRS